MEMTGQKALESLLKEFEKVPSRDVCRVATEQQMERIAADFDFETMEEFFEDHCLHLDLCVSQIPAELRMEAIVYFAMLTEYVDPCIVEDEVWDRHDEETADFLTSVKEIFQIYEDGRCDDVLDISVVELLEYARSGMPDF